VDVELLDTSVLSRKAIVRKIAALKTNDILLYMTFSKYADGKTYTYKEASNLVVKNARVPVFTLFWIGNGTLGGIAPNSTDSGKVAGEMASDVIDGKPMSEVKSRSADKGVATFDAKVMKKYGVKRSRLPSGATLVHDDTSYTRLIIIILALVIMMIVLAALMIKLRKDNRIKEEQENQLRRISDRLKTEAEIDTLTKLGNRRLFDRELESSANSTRQFELFLVDIDDFKGINDKYGHQVGDEILAEVGARLNRIKCRQLMPYRYGGDEFTITYFSSDEDKKEIGLEILKLFDEPIVTRTGELEIHISVGSAIYPADADTPDGLFHCADKALYTVKNKGKGGFEKYSNAKRGK
jgi:diguanylate cyclase (GGDEF)-like protein